MTDRPDNADPDATQTSLDRYRIMSPDTLVAERYRIRGLVGIGGMGVVYRAHDERLHVDVALKVLRPERAPDAHMLERFEQELILARQVSHRNVVRIHDIGKHVGEHDEVHFLTMDHVEGRSLKQLLDEQGRLDIATGISIAADLAEGLAAAHREGIVHRDLKPANVLIDADGRACVTDFGVARSLNRAAMTRAGSVVGTLDYLAPEQARGEPVDARCDVYALGLILFEMLSGQLPFSGESFEEVLAQRTVGRPRELGELGIDAPAWLRRVLTRCLEREPDRRYPDAVELAADLAAGRATSRPRLGRRALAAGAAALVLIVLGGIGYWLAGREGGPLVDRATEVVAIPPLVNQTGQGEFDWLSTGLAEMLAQALAESPNLQIVDSLRVFRTLEDLHLAPAALAGPRLRRLGELLDVDRLVLGTIRESGGRVRVELRLVDVRLPDARAETLQAETASLGALFALADELGGQLRALLAVAPAGSVTPVLSADPVAMAAYSEGLERLLQGDSMAAVPALRRAVAADARFPAAWVRLATAFAQLGYDDRALEAAHQAVAQLGETSGRIGFEARAQEAILSGDFVRAQQILTALVERYPHDIDARVALSEALGEHGQLERAREQLEAIVEASPNHPRAWYLLGKYAILAGDSRAAVDEYLVRALVIQNKLGNLQGRADVQNALGIAYHQLGELALAEERYRAALQLRAQIGDERGVAAATANIARIDMREGDYEAARAGLEQALETVERIGDRQTVANLHADIGYIEEQQGGYRSALESYRKALAVLRDLGNQRALAESYNNVGFTYYLLGEFDNAAVYAKQAVQIYTDTGNREGLMVANQTIGQLELARGNWEAALKALLQVLEIGRELDDPQAEAVALGNIGRVAQYQGRYAAAQSSYRDALAVLERLGDPRGLVEYSLHEASLLIDIGMHPAAAQTLARVSAWLDASGNREQRADWLRLTGLQRLRAGELPAARDSFAAAVEAANASGSVVAQLAARLAHAEALLAAGEVAAAAAALEALHRDAEGLGHLVLSLQSAELLGRARRELGDLDAAERGLRGGLRVAESHRPYAGHYRLHAMLAEVLQAQSKSAQASEQQRAAVAELARLRAELDSIQRAAFEQLTEVREVDRQVALDPAA